MTEFRQIRISTLVGILIIAAFTIFLAVGLKVKQPRHVIEGARDVKFRAYVQAIHAAAFQYEKDNGRLPDNQDQLVGKYLEWPIENPWGYPYRLSSNQSEGILTVHCIGEDGEENSADDRRSTEPLQTYKT